MNLNDSHLRQAVNYGATEGIQWVILTNGLKWNVFNIKLKKSVVTEKVFSFDFQNINPRKSEDQELLFLLAKEGIVKDVMGEYQERVKTVNPYTISAILLNKPGLDFVRRELRKITPGLKVDVVEIEELLRNEVLKRNILESEEGEESYKKLKRAIKRAAKKKAAT